MTEFTKTDQAEDAKREWIVQFGKTDGTTRPSEVLVSGFVRGEAAWVAARLAALILELKQFDGVDAERYAVFLEEALTPEEEALVEGE